MSNLNKRRLVIEHAGLVAAFAAGDRTVRTELREIEQALGLNGTQIAQLAADEYMRDY